MTAVLPLVCDEGLPFIVWVVVVHASLYFGRALHSLCLARQGFNEGVADAWSLVQEHGSQLNEAASDILSTVFVEGAQCECQRATTFAQSLRTRFYWMTQMNEPCKCEKLFATVILGKHSHSFRFYMRASIWPDGVRCRFQRMWSKRRSFN